MRYTITFIAAAVLSLSLFSCGTSSSRRDDTVRITGIVEVLHAGTRSETVIITEDSTGEVFALVGELAYDMIPDYGMTTAVTGRLTEEGYSVREDLRKIHVIDYSFLSLDEGEDF